MFGDFRFGNMAYIRRRTQLILYYEYIKDVKTVDFRKLKSRFRLLLMKKSSILLLFMPLNLCSHCISDPLYLGRLELAKNLISR